MSVHCNNIWLAHLTNILVNNCITIARRKCAACKNGIKSSLLHYHLQSSLFEKVKDHFEEVRGPMINKIDSCYNVFESKPDNLENKEQYLFGGQTFLLLSTPESIYFGRYVTEELDVLLFPRVRPEALKIMSEDMNNSTSLKPSKYRKKEKKVAPIYKKDSEDGSLKESDISFNFQHCYE